MTVTSTRKSTADTLKRMSVMHWVKRGFSCSVEQGVLRGGRLRADVIAMNLRGELIITEIKSCRADFVSDLKWEQYLPYCDKLYMCWPKDFGIQLPKHVGLLLPNTRGHLSVVKNATATSMVGKVRKELIIRMAWRAGQFNKSNTRRIRMYLNTT